MTADSSENKRGLRKTRIGTVISNAADKTVTVRIDRRQAHPKYHKVVNKTRKYYVHDEKNEANVGDVVEIAETRPLSKTKRWRLVSILTKSSSAVL